MVLYLRACFTSWTTGSGLTSWARITLGKKQRWVKYFPGKAGDAATDVRAPPDPLVRHSPTKRDHQAATAELGDTGQAGELAVPSPAHLAEV